MIFLECSQTYFIFALAAVYSNVPGSDRWHDVISTLYFIYIIIIAYMLVDIVIYHRIQFLFLICLWFYVYISFIIKDIHLIAVKSFWISLLGSCSFSSLRGAND